MSSIRIPVPVIVGHLKPVIVLPAAALSGLSPAHLEAVIAHELAHVRRHDYLVNLAQTVIETLLFYHPAVWWVSPHVRVAREHCCDDLAVTVCRSRHEYVRALLDLEELRDATPALALGATDGSLLARGRRLLVPQQGRTSPPRLAASVIALMVVAAAVTGASFNAALVPATPALELTATVRRTSRFAPDRPARQCDVSGRVPGYDRPARQPLGVGHGRGAHRAAPDVLGWLQHLAGQDPAGLRVSRPLEQDRAAVT